MQTKKIEIDFDGNVKALIKIEKGILTVEKAVNGYGEVISVKKVKINTITK